MMLSAISFAAFAGCQGSGTDDGDDTTEENGGDGGSDSGNSED